MEIFNPIYNVALKYLRENKELAKKVELQDEALKTKDEELAKQQKMIEELKKQLKDKKE